MIKNFHFSFNGYTINNTVELIQRSDISYYHAIHPITDLAGIGFLVSHLLFFPLCTRIAFPYYYKLI